MFGDIRPARAARGQVWLPVRLHLLCRPGSPGPVPARGRRCLPRVCKARVLAPHGLTVELCGRALLHLGTQDRDLCPHGAQGCPLPGLGVRPAQCPLRLEAGAETMAWDPPELSSGSGQPGVH